MTDHTTKQASQKIPYGYCQCGCGQKAPLAKRKQTKNGVQYEKNQPFRFLPGHHTEPAQNRFWENVDKQGENSCWNWTAGHRPNGYGRFSISNKSISTHRFSYELFNGQIPPGMAVLHTCDNRLCVNPAHLYLGTAKENNRDTKERNRLNPRRGTNAKTSKLTEQDVIKIRERYAAGSVTM